MTKLKRLSDMGISQDPSLAQADVTNAPHLFGDPSMGDFEEAGDNLYGDMEAGDVDPLSVFDAVSGDVEEEGDLRSTMAALASWAKRNKRGLAIGGAALGAGAAAVLVRKAMRKAAARKSVQRALQQEAYNQTIRKTSLIQSSVGKQNKASLMRFFSLKGAKMNSSPIEPLSTFVCDMFKNMLDRQAMDTPFYQETATGAFAAGTWTATATGTATPRYYISLILQIGTNILNASPGTIINLTGTFPTIAGNLVVAGTPWLFTYEKQFDTRFIFNPWQLVSNKPLPVLGQYSNANNIIATVTGIPAQSVVNLIVPGSIHPWIIAMRNSLID